MFKSVHNAIDHAYWGASLVQCEECAREVSAHDAIWRGQHAFCSVEHEAVDQLHPPMGTPLVESIDLRQSAAA